MAAHSHTSACCSIPPIIAKDYEAKGKYETIGGVKTYVTGPSDATKAIFLISDVFGYFPQTVQGADIISTSDDHQKYIVFIPDFFDGNPAEIGWFPPKTDEHKQKLGTFLTVTHEPTKTAARVPDMIKAIEEKYSGIKTWGIQGFCWGAKVVSLLISSTTIFSVAAVCHPYAVESKDAEKIKIPYCMLPSGDEPADEVKKFEENLSGEKYVETFSDQIHGWMAARSDLENERVKSEYERGYKIVVEFFGKYLK